MDLIQRDLVGNELERRGIRWLLKQLNIDLAARSNWFNSGRPRIFNRSDQIDLGIEGAVDSTAPHVGTSHLGDSTAPESSRDSRELAPARQAGIRIRNDQNQTFGLFGRRSPGKGTNKVDDVPAIRFIELVFEGRHGVFPFGDGLK